MERVAITDEIEPQPKRKSPFIGSNESISELADARSISKLARQEVPELRENECEFFIDMKSMMEEVDAESRSDDTKSGRVERSSELCRSGDLHFQLVCYLSRGEDENEACGPIYDLGMYVRALSPGNDSSEWIFRRTTFMLMLLNAADPFSRRSRVLRDVCDLSASDACRGWPMVLSFGSLEELEEEGFIDCRTNARICIRGQVYYSGRGNVKWRGLENQGATCYLNGLLQSLFHIGRFREIIYREAEEGSIIWALQKVFFELERTADSKRDDVSSEPLTSAFGWDREDVGVQHDVQEMNRLLIDRIESRLCEDEEKKLKKIFCGILENYISCTNIDCKSTRTEDFYDIQLNLVNRNGEAISSVEDALKEYLSVEILEGANAYDAGEGKGMQRAEKGVRFASLPPILTFQLMRFQFDYDSGEFRKLNNFFSFQETLLVEEKRYRLYSVLVHAGGVDGGHYYAFLNLQGWIKFDDTHVEEVDAGTAIADNYGGTASCEPETNVVNYLYSPDPSKSTAENNKLYSAYMLMYVEEDSWADLLTPVRLVDVNPDLLLRLEAAPDDTEKTITIKFLDEDSSCMLDVASYANLLGKDDACFTQVMRRFAVSDLVDMTEKSCYFMIVSDTKRAALKLVNLKDAGSSLEHDEEIVLVKAVVAGAEKDVIPVGLLEFFSLEKKLKFSKVIWINISHIVGSLRAQLPDKSLAAFVLTGQYQMEPVSQDSVFPGCFIVYHETEIHESAKDYYLRLFHTRDLTIQVYDWKKSKWLLNGVPAHPQIFANPHSMKDHIFFTFHHSLKNIDCRKPASELLNHIPSAPSSRLMLFHHNPFTSIATRNIYDADVEIDNILNNRLELHCVFIPLPPAVLQGPTCRWETTRPVVVRLFDDHVVEQNSDFFYLSPGTTIHDLVIQARIAFSLDPNVRYRVLDIDIVNCEISAVFSQDDNTTPLSALLFWGASNIFINSVRIEPDHQSDPPAREQILCSHLDRSTRSRFGHPFILDGNDDPSTDEESQIANKLNIPAAFVRSWRIIVQTQGTLVISHSSNPFNTDLTPRERPLVIKS